MSIPSLLRMISGQRKGVLASTIRGGLSCLTPIYRFAIRYRNRQFDSGAREIKSVSAKVISIGNITTGGTGKTPMVVWVCQLLSNHSVSVGIVSRGYGAADGEQVKNDEAMELENRLPSVPHVQNRDRVQAAKNCIEENHVEAIVLDDGFQHRRINRDLDIVLIDASNPFGYDRLLPRGLLREPVSSLNRADCVVVTRSERVNFPQLEGILGQIKSATKAPVMLSRTKATALIQFSGHRQRLDRSGDFKWFAFSAIGNPSAFEDALVEDGFEVVGSCQYRDHHLYTQDDMDAIVMQARACGAERLICTHKDLVKIGRDEIEGMPVQALLIELEIVDGKQQLEQLILSTVEEK